MRASIFTSKIWLLLLGVFLAFNVHANDGFGTANQPKDSGNDEDSFSNPYTDYADFNDDEEEAESLHYLQNGRFFGVSLGIGAHGATGNRGALWNGGFPLIDLKIHYWFNFHFAIQMGYYTAPHSYVQNQNSVKDTVSVRFNRMGVDLKYYFDTRDRGSAITFASPYLLLGGGSFTKVQKALKSQTSDTDVELGLTTGAGLEFTLSPKRVFFFFQGTYDLVNFKDSATSDFEGSNNLPDLSGNFFSFVGGFLFTW